jgi:hypothetical protein
MLVEGRNGLLVPVLEEMKSSAIKAVDSPVVVGHNHIQQHQIGVGAQNESAGLGLGGRLCCFGSACGSLAGCGGSQQSGKKESGAESK